MAITYPGYDDNPERVVYEGAVLADGEMNYHDDSDFYAVVWDAEKGIVTRVDYNTTRSGGGGSCVIDATDEVKEAASAYLREFLYKWWVDAQESDSKVACIGREVRFVKGRPALKLDDDTRKPIKLGTTGTVVWREERKSLHGTWSYGFRLGIAVGKAVVKQYSIRTRRDILSVTSPFSQHFPWDARQIGGNWNKKRKVWTFPADRRDEVEALCERYFPSKPKNTVWTDEGNVEVVNPEQHMPPEEEGRARAAASDRNWRGATATHSLPVI